MPETARMFQRPIRYSIKLFRFSKFARAGFSFSRAANQTRAERSTLIYRPQPGPAKRSEVTEAPCSSACPGTRRTNPFISRSKSVARTSEEFKPVFSTMWSIGRGSSALQVGVDLLAAAVPVMPRRAGCFAEFQAVRAWPGRLDQQVGCEAGRLRFRGRPFACRRVLACECRLLRGSARSEFACCLAHRAASADRKSGEASAASG